MNRIMTFIDLTCFSLIALRQETTFRWSSASLVSFSTEAFEIESSLVRAKVTISYHVKKRTKKLVLRYCATTRNIPPPGKKRQPPAGDIELPCYLNSLETRKRHQSISGWSDKINFRI